jgi:hypothetical protein
MDFEKKYAFIDETGFKLHISSTKDWSKLGEPAKAEVEKNKGSSVTSLVKK